MLQVVWEWAWKTKEVALVVRCPAALGVAPEIFETRPSERVAPYPLPEKAAATVSSAVFHHE